MEQKRSVAEAIAESIWFFLLISLFSCLPLILLSKILDADFQAYGWLLVSSAFFAVLPKRNFRLKWGMIGIALPAFLIFVFIKRVTVIRGFKLAWNLMMTKCEDFTMYIMPRFSYNGTFRQSYVNMFISVLTVLVVIVSAIAVRKGLIAFWIVVDIAVMLACFCTNTGKNRIAIAGLSVGMMLFLCITGKFHPFKARKKILYGILTAALMFGLYMGCNRIISPELYNSKIKNALYRKRVYLQLKRIFEKTDSPIDFGTGNGNLKKSKNQAILHIPQLQVTFPSNLKKVYLRGFIGKEYRNSEWKSKGTDESDSNIMFQYSSITGISTAYSIGQIMQQYMEGNLTGETQRFPVWYANMSVKQLVQSDTVYLPYDTLFASDGKQVFREKPKGNGEVEGLKDKAPEEYYAGFYYSLTDNPLFWAFIDNSKNSIGGGNNGYASEAFQIYERAYKIRCLYKYLDIPNNFLYAVSSCDLMPDGIPPEGYTVWDAVECVRQYLQENYEYTLQPGEVPDGWDVVEYFLFENKKGYCTHFASAGALLLRALGVPARYVGGYVINSDVKRMSVGKGVVQVKENGVTSSVEVPFDTVVLDDGQAHAWVEIYLDGYGWYPVEMTPGYGNSSYKNKNSILKPTPTPTPTPEVTPKATGTPTVTATPKPTKVPKATVTVTAAPNMKEANQRKPIDRTVWYIIFIVLGIIAVAVIVRLRVCYYERKRERAYNDPSVNDAIIAMATELGRLLRLCGYKAPLYETDKEYLRRIADTDERFRSLNGVELCIDEAVFSKQPLQEERRETVAAVYREIRTRILADSPWWKRLYLRIVRCV